MVLLKEFGGCASGYCKSDSLAMRTNALVGSGTQTHRDTDQGVCETIDERPECPAKKRGKLY
jgi:hypothetical protein